MILPVSMAPMVGISHWPFRRLVSSYLPKRFQVVWPTEMLNSRRLPGEKVGATPETLKGEDEAFIAPQILGNEENFIAKSIEKLEAWGATAIDINMGCPVKKALQHNYGVSLMGDPEYARSVVGMAVRNSKVPISVKLRSGTTEDLVFLKKFIEGLYSEGASWVTLHPRLAGQQRRGVAKWDTIRELKTSLGRTLIGNGDVQVVEDIDNMFLQTGCDGVMIGRALTARPWILRQYLHRKNLLEAGESLPPQTEYEEGAEYGKALILMAQFCQESFAPELGLRKFKFFVKTGSPWLEFGHFLFSGVSGCHSLKEVEIFLLKFFSQPQKMYGRTTLRQ